MQSGEAILIWTRFVWPAQPPLRHPVELAQCILTTHLLSERRFRFGLGDGLIEGDFNAVGVNFADRFKLLKESLASI